MTSGFLNRKPEFSRPIYLVRPFLPQRKELNPILDTLYSSRVLSNNGPFVQRLEESLTRYLRVKYVVAVSSATLGMQLVIRGLGLKGEVILPSFTFIATAHAMSWEGLRPVFADIEAQHLGIDPESVKRRINSRTSAIVGVHLFGNPCAIAELEALAKKHNLVCLFDSAQAMGSEYLSKRVGAFGRAEVFSLHATKIVHGLEGGFIATNDAKLYERLRYYRNFGFQGYDRVVSLGINAKLNEFSAAIAWSSLQHLPQQIAANKRVHQMYRKALMGLPGIRPIAARPGCRINFNSFPILIEAEYGVSRDRLCDVLWKNNILARRYYYPGCHRQAPYKSRRQPGDLTNTETISANILSLPCYSTLEPREIAKIVNVLQLAHENRMTVMKSYAARSLQN